MDGIKLLAIATMLATPLSFADVYKCTVDGKVIFSQEPCATDAKPMDLSNVGSFVTNDNKQAKSPEATAKQSEISNYIHAEDIKREITRLQHKREKVFNDRDARIQRLRQSRNYASNNLAGATWEKSLAEEMSAVSRAADSEVQSIDREIASLQQELQSL
ncbi:hypothetical protein PY479_05215 [Shewanella sp. A32]|uniref:hypothetical protein n=1 Tax=Shewanella sp. A32 TaxID=3031327 RepID=UPI0023B91B8C|nr:hypothetical protein [Shewanella sp. A32]MDF0533679.1 hypothetical protein [Shewanella sp. A32]